MILLKKLLYQPLAGPKCQERRFNVVMRSCPKNSLHQNRVYRRFRAINWIQRGEALDSCLAIRDSQVQSTVCISSVVVDPCWVTKTQMRQMFLNAAPTIP